ncbi:MAG: Trp family transcriptional regulator [Candidatus Moraniibacteriota bacterium]
MGKVQTKNIDKNKRYEIIGDFYDIVTNLKTKKEVIGFFMGLPTPSEALMFARRIQIVKMLLDDKSYDDIRDELKVGGATIANVSQWLYGEDESFRVKIEEHKKNCAKINSNKRRDYGNLLDKYPQHRILKDLLGL